MWYIVFVDWYSWTNNKPAVKTKRHRVWAQSTSEASIKAIDRTVGAYNPQISMIWPEWPQGEPPYDPQNPSRTSSVSERPRAAV